MDQLKYQILCQVHSSSSVTPVYKGDILAHSADINAANAALKNLLALGYISQDIGSNKLRITTAGTLALENTRELLNLGRKEDIRYWITTAIALAALVLSVIALILR